MRKRRRRRQRRRECCTGGCDAAFGPRVDECALGVGVGDGGDAAVGVLSCDEQAQGAPAAAKLQDVLSVHELGAFAVEVCGTIGG